MIVICLACIVSAFNGHYLGSAMTAIRETFGIDYASGGLVVGITSVVSMLTAFITGYFLDKVGPKPLILIGLGVSIVGMLIAAFSPTMAVLVVGRAIGGFGGNAVYVSNTNLMGRLPGDSRKGYTAMHNCFGIGGILTPMVVLLVLSYSPIGWRTMPVITTVGYALLILLYARMTVPPQAPPVAEDGTVTDTPFKNIRLYILAGTNMAYMAVEITITSWMVSYLQASGLVPAFFSQYFLTIYWALIFVGRIIGLRMTKHMSTERLLIISSAGMLVFYVLFLLSDGSLLLAVSTIMLGLFMAPIYPMTVANVREAVGMTGKVGSVLSITESMICAVTPVFVGFIGDLTSLRQGMSWIIAAGVVTLILTLFNGYRAQRSRKAKAEMQS